MKLSCLPVSYFGEIIAGTMSVGQWAREAASVGLDAVDLSILFVEGLDLSDLRAMRQEIEDARMRVAMVTTYPDFTNPSAEVRAVEAVRLEQHLAAAAALGAAMVRATAGQAHPETEREDGLTWAIEGLTGALPVAEKHGIQLLFENHSKPGVWDYADFAQPTDIFLSIVEATAGTALGVNFDTANTPGCRRRSTAGPRAGDGSGGERACSGYPHARYPGTDCDRHWPGAFRRGLCAATKQGI